MLGFWLLMMAATSAAFGPIKLYEGTWTLVAAHTMAGEGKPDTIVNHCHEGTAFYTCEQVVNGKSLALVVFQRRMIRRSFIRSRYFRAGRRMGGVT